jgi:hypothetical protein
VKSGHCHIQIQPLRAKPGQYRFVERHNYSPSSSPSRGSSEFRSFHTAWAMSDRLHCGKTASLFAITNSVSIEISSRHRQFEKQKPLTTTVGRKRAKSRQLLEQRLSLLQIKRVEAFGEPHELTGNFAASAGPRPW